MKNLDINLWRSTLLNHFKYNLEKFATTTENKDVYCLILDCHATYGNVNLKWNTLDSFKKHVNKHYSSYTSDKLLGFRGLEYNVGDFSYEDTKQPELINEFEQLYEAKLSEFFDDEDEESSNELTQKFINALVEIIFELRPTFSKLNKTGHFISFIVEHDSEYYEYIKKTVTIEDYYKAFPEVKEYEQYLSIISSTSKEEQVTHWSNLLYEFIIGNETEGTRSLKQMYRHKYDVEEEIIKLGVIASREVVTLFEVFSGYTPSIVGQIIQSDSHTRWMFLSILIDINNANEETINRLKQILIRKYEVDNEVQECINIARTLHTLDSVRFPEEMHDEGRLRLLNYEEYKNI